jgi:hypothetical protein
MLKVSIAPVTIWPGCEPFFLFSRPDFVSVEKNSQTSTPIFVESKEKDIATLFILSKHIKDMAKSIKDKSEPHFFAVCVLGEMDEVNEVFFYLDPLLGINVDIEVYIENSVKEKDEPVFFFEVPESKRTEFFLQILEEQHQN